VKTGPREPREPTIPKALARVDRAAITAAQLQEIRGQIARVATVLEAKAYRAWAASVQDALRRRRKLGQTLELRGAVTDIELDTAEFRIEALRREGDLLLIMAEREERAGRGKPIMAQRGPLSRATLPDLGYDSHGEVDRAVNISRIRDPIVRDYFQSQRTRREPASVAGLMMYAADAEKRTTSQTPELRPGEYRTLVVDPPWPMHKSARTAAPEQGRRLDYPTMTLDAIRDLPVASLAGQNAHLYLWTTHHFLPDAFAIMQAWGFEYHCLLTWLKPGGFTPFSFMFNTEHVLFGYRDALEVARPGLKVGFQASAVGHSRKPAAFYDLVEEASPGPRIELFARAPRPDWTVWGDEAP
jgi:N6-adenosine-specific RNA methylase IME4